MQRIPPENKPIAARTSKTSYNDQHSYRWGRSMIIDEVYENLYVSGIIAVQAQDVVYVEGVRAVVRLDSAFRQRGHWDDRFTVLDLPMMDGELIPDGYIEQVTRFIKEQHDADKPVLVHCAMGMSRSVSMAMAYLIEYEGMSLPESFQTVREGRVVAHPHEQMLRSLVEHYDLPYGMDEINGTQFLSRLASE